MSLLGGQRIEIRGFGSFELNYRPARIGRNPKTGASVPVPEKFAPHFKAGTPQAPPAALAIEGRQREGPVDFCYAMLLELIILRHCNRLPAKKHVPASPRVTPKGK